MTTTAARQQKAPTHDFQHGPVAAAFNASVVTLFATTAGKAIGLPPWIALVGAGITAGAMVVAGRARRPRPLSRASLLFRAAAMGSSGLWMWWQLATFTNPGLSAGQLGFLLAGWPITVLLFAAAFLVPQVPALVRYAIPAMVALFTATLTVVLGGPVVDAVSDALTVTDRLPMGWGHLNANLSWLGKSLVSIIMIAGPLAVLGRVFGNREMTADEELAARERRAVPARSSHQAKVMLKLICDATSEYTSLTGLRERGAPPVKVPNLAIDDVKPWDNGGGETYLVNLVGGKGTTVQSLRGHTTLWATKMNLPAGCGVEVLGPESEPERELGRGYALVKVSRKNMLKGKIMYPALLPRTVMNMLPIGITRDGKQIGPYLRESSVFLWGQKGSGKTKTLEDITTGLLQCTDVLVWGIDLNGGGAFTQFLRGWKDGKVDRPCIDWVATTLKEAQTMAEVGLDIALDRKVYYSDLKYEHDATLMPVGNGEPGQPPPQIAIIIDEGAAVMGVGLGGAPSMEQKEAKAKLQAIMDMARDAGVNIIFCGLRATEDVASGAFKAGTAVRIGMRVTDANELSYGFGVYNLNVDEISDAGCGFICTGHDENEIQVFKSYFQSPKDLERAGIETTGWQPYLDDRGLKVGGTRYANRWQRSGPRMFKDCPEHVTRYGAAPVTAEDRATASSAAQAGGVVAVQDRPEPSTGVPTRQFRPTGIQGEGANFNDLMNAAADAEAQYLGKPVPPAPACGGGDPPAGGDRPDRADQPDQDDSYEPDDVKLKDDFVRGMRQITDLLAESARTGVPPDLRDPRSIMPVSAETEEALNPRSREILERLVRTHGPLTWRRMHEMLNAGGGWGPAVKMTEQGLRRLTYKPGTKEPVDWLAPRAPKEPYQHRDNLK